MTSRSTLVPFLALLLSAGVAAAPAAKPATPTATESTQWAKTIERVADSIVTVRVEMPTQQPEFLICC